MVANIQPSSKTVSSYPSGATGHKLMIMWSYKARTCHYYKTFLEVVDLSWLNCFLVDCHLNFLEGCILELWPEDFYVVVIIQYLFRWNVLHEHCNTVIKQQLYGEDYNIIQVLVLFYCQFSCLCSKLMFLLTVVSACISTQGVTRMYDHTATEIP